MAEFRAINSESLRLSNRQHLADFFSWGRTWAWEPDTPGPVYGGTRIREHCKPTPPLPTNQKVDDIVVLPDLQPPPNGRTNHIRDKASSQSRDQRACLSHYQYVSLVRLYNGFIIKYCHQSILTNRNPFDCSTILLKYYVYTQILSILYVSQSLIIVEMQNKSNQSIK